MGLAAPVWGPCSAHPRKADAKKVRPCEVERLPPQKGPCGWEKGLVERRRDASSAAQVCAFLKAGPGQLPKLMP